MPDEPSVVIHADLHCRNIMMQGIRLVGVSDWEFSEVYLLSKIETWVDVREMMDDETEEEYF